MPQLTKTKSHRKSRSCSKTTASVNTVKITKCACCSIFTFEKCLIASHNHMFVIIKHWLLSSRDCEFARAWNFWSINSVSVCLFGMNYQLYFPLFTFMNEIGVKFFSPNSSAWSGDPQTKRFVHHLGVGQQKYFCSTTC